MTPEQKRRAAVVDKNYGKGRATTSGRAKPSVKVRPWKLGSKSVGFQITRKW